MGQKVGTSRLTVIGEGSAVKGYSVDDVCRTPAPPAPFIPIPYPSSAPPVGPSSSMKTRMAGKSVSGLKDAAFRMSTGDEAGTLMGVQKRIALAQQLQIAGFTPVAAEAMVAGRQIEGSADKMLLYSYINRGKS